MKNLQTFDEFLNEASSSDKVFIQQNTLWLAWNPNSGLTTQIKGNPDEFRGYFSTDKSDTAHYDVSVERFLDWSKGVKPDAKGPKYTLYKIPCYWAYKPHDELTVFGGNVKPDYYVWMGLVSMGNGHYLLHLFKTKGEAVAFLK